MKRKKKKRPCLPLKDFSSKIIMSVYSLFYIWYYRDCCTCVPKWHNKTYSTKFHITVVLQHCDKTEDTRRLFQSTCCRLNWCLSTSLRLAPFHNLWLRCSFSSGTCLTLTHPASAACFLLQGNAWLVLMMGGWSLQSNLSIGGSWVLHGWRCHKDGKVDVGIHEGRGVVGVRGL